MKHLNIKYKKAATTGSTCTIIANNSFIITKEDYSKNLSPCFLLFIWLLRTYPKLSLNFNNPFYSEITLRIVKYIKNNLSTSSLSAQSR